MVYFKLIDEEGFVSVSTLNAETGGNITKAEYDTIAEMYRNAQSGYGVIETENGFEYAERPKSSEDDELTADEALSIITGGES